MKRLYDTNRLIAWAVNYSLVLLNFKILLQWKFYNMCALFIASHTYGSTDFLQSVLSKTLLYHVF